MNILNSDFRYGQTIKFRSIQKFLSKKFEKRSKISLGRNI